MCLSTRGSKSSALNWDSFGNKLPRRLQTNPPRIVIIITITLVLLTFLQSSIHDHSGLKVKEIGSSKAKRERSLCIKCIDKYLISDKVIQMEEMTQGYGNRIYSFLNVLALGIVTKRSVVC